MNPLLNPATALKFMKNNIVDTGRINRLNPQQLEKYRDKALRKMIAYAYTVPLYKKKYKEAGIHPNDIKGISDIQKLPFITRKDFRDNYPDGVLPTNYDKSKGYVVCTGGTTGRYCCNSGAEPVCIYTDFSTMVRAIALTLRENRHLNLNWRNTKIAHLGNFNPFKFDNVFEKHVASHLKTFSSFKNYLSISASDPTQKIIKKLEEFKPDVIISYPAIYQELTYQRRKGIGKKIQPKLLQVGGAMLDNYTKRNIEDAFGCPVLNVYASCEAGANIAYECPDGGWHIHSDFFHLEAVDQNMNPVAPGERGHIVITRLWGTATPIIRYTGMKDWITLGTGTKCTCGINSPIFDKPVEGRVASNIVLPNGKIYPPSTFLLITPVLKELNTFMVKKFQIVQKKIDEIDILLVIDDDMRDSGPTFNEIAEKIKKIYEEETGPDVTINVKEVKEIKDDPTTGKPAPLVVSQINIDEACPINQ